MHRNELPRIYELRDLLKTRKSSDAYFQNFDNSLTSAPVKLKHFKGIEADLRRLDDAAWAFLKEEVALSFKKKDSTRGWQQAFDRLNEAKGYNYLIQLGCRRVEFIPRSGKEGQETPDLKGVLGSTPVLCEVKTINPSDVEAKARMQPFALKCRPASPPRPFFDNLTKTLEKAKRQMDSYCSEAETRKIAYVVIDFDDLSPEYVKTYSKQLAAYKREAPVQGIEIVFDFKPTFSVGSSVTV